MLIFLVYIYIYTDSILALLTRAYARIVANAAKLFELRIKCKQTIREIKPMAKTKKKTESEGKANRTRTKQDTYAIYSKCQ